MTDHSPNNVQSNYLLDTWVYREAFEEKVVTCVAIRSYMPRAYRLAKSGERACNFRVGSVDSSQQWHKPQSRPSIY